MGQLVKYTNYSIEEAEQDEEEIAKGSGGEFWRPPAGESRVRILPGRAGSSAFVKRWTHWVDVPGATKRVGFVCPRMQSAMLKQGARFCPACAKLDELREDSRPAAQDAAKKLEPKKKWVCNIIFRGDPEHGPYVWEIGPMIQKQLAGLRKNEDAGGVFTDPGPEGFDLIVTRAGSQMNTEYTVLASRKLSKLADDDTANAWLESMPDLARYGRVPTDEEIRRLTGGGARDRQEVDVTPRRAAGRGAPAPQQARRRTAADDAIDADYEVDADE